jgi:hypothetical protein
LIKIITNPVKDLSKGFTVGDFSIYAKKITAGRFIEEFNLDIYIRKDNNEAYVLSAKIFFGRKPYYLPWVELFNIHNQLDIGRDIYFDSAYEKQLISYFSNFLNPAGRIFIEYYTDTETMYGLQSGFPPATTRLGFRLFENGFTWFKDWYFPEGFMEGGQKLQGEKTSNMESKNRQLMQILKEIKVFLEKTELSYEYDHYERNVVERAGKILGTYKQSKKKKKQNIS